MAQRQAERWQELATFLTKLARLAGVVRSQQCGCPRGLAFADVALDVFDDDDGIIDDQPNRGQCQGWVLVNGYGS